MRLKDPFSNLSGCLDIAAHIHSQESYSDLLHAKQIHNYLKVCQEMQGKKDLVLTFWVFLGANWELSSLILIHE